jgi:RNA polymerase sigma-70 factor (ECF subfamily)
VSDTHADENLIALAARGDERAFSELVRRHQHWVRRLAFRYARQGQDAEELAQEIFLRAWRYAGSFRGEASFATWLYRLAVNACLNFTTGRRARPQPLPLNEGLESGEPAVGAGLAAGERDARLREALASLPARQRLALVLASFEDKSYEEIAAALGTSVSSVESLLFRARRRLAAALRPLRERGEI